MGLHAIIAQGAARTRQKTAQRSRELFRDSAVRSFIRLQVRCLASHQKTKTVIWRRGDLFKNDT